MRKKLISFIAVNIIYIMIVFYVNGTLYPSIQSDRVFIVFMWLIFNAITAFIHLLKDTD